MRILLISILMFSLTILVGCKNTETSEKNKGDTGKESETAKSDTRAKDEAAIRKLPIEDWCKAEAARDLDAKMKLFTEDVVFMVPGEATFSGKAAVRAKHEEWWKGTEWKCEGEIDEVKVSDDWGAVSGRVSGTETAADGKTRKITGKFINLVRRESDGWKISRVIWNTD